MDEGAKDRRRNIGEFHHLGLPLKEWAIECSVKEWRVVGDECFVDNKLLFLDDERDESLRSTENGESLVTCAKS